MRVTIHGEHLIQLTQYPRVFPINAYLVREDDGWTLIDTGMRGNAAAILAAAKAHGGAIRRLLLTHAHGDHVGSVDALHAALPEAPVLISGRDARLLAGDRIGEAHEPSAKPRGSVPTIATRPSGTLIPGECIGALAIVAAPGHTPGQVACFDRRDGTLIAGDAFQTRGGIAVAGVVRWTFPFPAFATWHRPTALASARSLRALAPERLAVGHGPVLTHPLSAIDEAIDAATRADHG